VKLWTVMSNVAQIFKTHLFQSNQM